MRESFNISRLAKFTQEDELIPAKILAAMGSSGAYSYTIQLGWWDMRTGAATGGTWTPKPAAATYTAFPENLITTTALAVGTYCQVKKRGRDNAGNKYWTIAGTTGAGGGTQLLYAKTTTGDTRSSAGNFAATTVSITPYNPVGTVLRLNLSIFQATYTSSVVFKVMTAGGAQLGINFGITFSGGFSSSFYHTLSIEMTSVGLNFWNMMWRYGCSNLVGGIPTTLNYGEDGANLGATPGAISVNYASGADQATLMLMNLEKLS